MEPELVAAVAVIAIETPVLGWLLWKQRKPEPPVTTGGVLDGPITVSDDVAGLT